MVMFLLGIAIFLVIYNNKDDNQNNKNDNGENPPNEETEIYATSFSLNIPDGIEIFINSKINFKSGFVNVTPSSMLSELEYEIAAKSGGTDGGLKFENNTLTATEIGEYTIKFKMPKSSSSYFSKTISILVYEEENKGHIYQTTKSIIIGEELDVNDLFQINSNKSFNVQTDNKISYSKNKIKALNLGESDISFKFTESYLEFVYNFTLSIKEEPKYVIELKNITNNVLTINLVDEFAYIQFEVVDRDEGDISQLVEVVSVDDNIATVNSYDINPPLIKITAKSVGETVIKIIYTLDITVQVEVKVIVN